MKKSLDIAIWIVKNKYLMTLLVFIIWILFFDSNSYLNQRRLNSALKKVESEKEFYISEIEKDKKTTQKLKSNPELLERYAREQFLMKRKNEDIFLIINKQD